MKSFLNIFLFIALSIQLAAQSTQPIVFGVATKEQLMQKQHPRYEDAPAAILYKYQKSYITGTSLSDIRFRTDYFVRYKIYNKEGLDYGTFRVPLMRFGHGDFLKSIQGTTLTLENDTIYSDLVNRDMIHIQKMDSYTSIMSVTFPNVKVGAILDVAFSIYGYSPVALPDVIHQAAIPVDRSEADISIPNYMVFQAYTKGFEDIHYNVYNKGGQQYYEITATDLPPIEEEEFINNINNYKAITNFEIKQTKYPLPSEKLGFTWKEIVKTIYKNDYFGDELKKRSYFKSDLKKILAANPGLDSLKLADTIFEFVKNRMNWNNFSTFITLNGLKKAYENRKGNSGEINLILTAMLREAGFDSNPVLLATRDKGIPVFPSIESFNYVLASIHYKGKDYLFDATEKYAVRDVLPLRAINWTGKLIRKDNTYEDIELFPDEMSEMKIQLSGLVLENGTIQGQLKAQMAQQYMLGFRGIKEIDYQDDYKKILEGIYQIEIDDLQDNTAIKTDTVYKESFSFATYNQTDVIGNKIYISPLLFYTTKVNPFKSKEREYPIDFMFPKTETYEIEFTLPEGYKVVYLPEPLSIKFVDELASFRYDIKQEEQKIKVQVHYTSTQSVVAASYYKMFQAFYNKIIDKENDKIVIEKTNTVTIKTQ